MKNLAIREQRRADGVSLDGCYNCSVIGYMARESHPAAKEEAATVGVTGVAEEAVEEGAALQVPASKTIKMLPQPATGRLRAATTASSRKSRRGFSASFQRCIQGICPGAERGHLYTA